MRILKSVFFQNPIIKKPLLIIHNTVWLILAKYLGDKTYIKLKYYVLLGKRVNLKNPVTFQEKLQWIKLNDRKEIYHKMVDKAEVKKFVADRIGQEYIIPTIGLWNSFDEIDYDKLPDQFILKCTFDSGSYYICKDKNKLDLNAVKRKLLVNWGKDYSIWAREWAYKGLKQRIIAEPLLNDGLGEYLTDYKFYTFNGVPKFYYVTSNRGSNTGLCEDFFDIKGNHMELSQRGFPNNKITPSLPVNLNIMIEISTILSKGTYHLRVDFYEVNGKIYFGELTFFDGGGFFKFNFEKYDRIIGDLIKLPIES